MFRFKSGGSSNFEYCYFGWSENHVDDLLILTLCLLKIFYSNFNLSQRGCDVLHNCWGCSCDKWEVGKLKNTYRNTLNIYGEGKC